MMKKIFLLLVSSAFMLSVNAQQEVNLKFGKSTKEEMAMTEYALDKDAGAAVMCRLYEVV